MKITKLDPSDYKLEQGGRSIAPFVAKGPNSYFVVLDGDIVYGNFSSHGTLIICAIEGNGDGFAILAHDLLEHQCLAQIRGHEPRITAGGILRNDGGRVIDWRLHLGFGFTTPEEMQGKIQDAILEAFGTVPDKEP